MFVFVYVYVRVCAHVCLFVRAFANQAIIFQSYDVNHQKSKVSTATYICIKTNEGERISEFLFVFLYSHSCFESWFVVVVVFNRLLFLEFQERKPDHVSGHCGGEGQPL